MHNFKDTKKELLLGFFSLFLSTQTNAQKLQNIINYYNGNKIATSTKLPFKEGSFVDNRNQKWNVDILKKEVDTQNETTDYIIKFTLQSAKADQVSLGVSFTFNEWSEDNFVFVPSIVYAGNRFEKKKMNYPPYWYEPDEWELNMPTTTPEVPSLEKHKDYGKIELTTGNAATPLMAFHSTNKNKSWMVQTLQKNQWGNFGYFIEEDKIKEEAIFSIMSPAVRETRATITGLVPSEDNGANLQKGDVVEIKFRTYKQSKSSLQDMYTLFLEKRKDLNPISYDYAVMPFSEGWRTMNELFKNNRWDESIQMYSLTKPGSNEGWNQIWQLGWVGGGQATLPLILKGDDYDVQCSMKNLNSIFERTQAPTGFFYIYGNGKEFKSFGYGKPLENNETFVRSQGDFLYMAQRQFIELKRRNKEVPSAWYQSLKKQADAFLNLWNKYKQVGQFVNIETGEICVGRSTSGGIVPAGLALASRTYNDKKYLVAAEGLADKFYIDYVKNGYTCGGPGEILSSPDSESAFGLFESFSVLYEITNNRKWLKYAKELLPICASWVVSYDYEFPEKSIMKQIGTHSTGAVWASIANKHGAPCICTWSGESLLKYFRATNDKYAIELLKDIAHGLPQYISHNDRVIGNMEPGGGCERVNLSDWEGKGAIGGNIFASCAWVEVGAMLSFTQLPSIYVQKDKGLVEVFDHLKVQTINHNDNEMELKITNLTKYDADAPVYIETSKEAKRSNYAITDINKIQNVHIKANQSVTIKIKK